MCFHKLLLIMKTKRMCFPKLTTYQEDQKNVFSQVGYLSRRPEEGVFTSWLLIKKTLEEDQKECVFTSWLLIKKTTKMCFHKLATYQEDQKKKFPISWKLCIHPEKCTGAASTYGQSKKNLLPASVGIMGSLSSFKDALSPLAPPASL